MEHSSSNGDNIFENVDGFCLFFLNNTLDISGSRWPNFRNSKATKTTPGSINFFRTGSQCPSYQKKRTALDTLEGALILLSFCYLNPDSVTCRPKCGRTCSIFFSTRENDADAIAAVTHRSDSFSGGWGRWHRRGNFRAHAKTNSNRNNRMATLQPIPSLRFDCRTSSQGNDGARNKWDL